MNMLYQALKLRSKISSHCTSAEGQFNDSESIHYWRRKALGASSALCVLV